MKLSSLSLAALAVTPSVYGVHEGVLQLHGSGTTNPSFCYWSIMETLTEQASIPIRMSYRAVGSTTGIAEFKELFINDGFDTTNVFGSGDIPIPQDDYNIITNNGADKNFIHLPVLAGAVSFFHSVPDTPNLNLTACLLSQIYLGQITSWGDPALKAVNPNLSAEAANTPIRPIVRLKGSSSTASATAYLHGACDVDEQKLPIDLVSDLPLWDEVVPGTTTACQGSGGVTDCIGEVPGSIGYLDAGHGIGAGIPEVRLHNKDSSELTFRTSQESSIEAAITRDALPASADDDFSAVDFLNKPGETTWPIVLMTYLYVPKNLTAFIEDPTEQSLLVAFLRSLYDDTYVKQCQEKYGFTLLSENDNVKAYTEDAIGLLNIDPNAPQWFFEADTTALTGAQRYVFSVKRQEIVDLRIEALEESVLSTDGTTAVGDNTVQSASALTIELETLRAEVRALEQDIIALKSGSVTTSALSDVEDAEIFTEDDEKQIKAALALGAISFAFWALWIIYALFKSVSGGGGGNTNVTGDAVVMSSGAANKNTARNGDDNDETAYG